MHAGADVIGGILHQQFDLASEHAAFGVDLIDRELGAHHLVAGRRGVDAGEGIDHADPDRRLAACLNEERGSDLKGAQRGGALHQHAPIELADKTLRCHELPPNDHCFVIGRFVWSDASKRQPLNLPM